MIYNVDPTDLIKAVASANRSELESLARKVWEEDLEVHPIHAIVLVDARSINVEGREVFYAVSEAYKLDHTTK